MASYFHEFFGRKVGHHKNSHKLLTYLRATQQENSTCQTADFHVPGM